MTAAAWKVIAVGAIHVALVAGVGAKYLVERAALPRVWVRAAPVDPDLPIRGRYVSLRLEVVARDVALPNPPVPITTPQGGTWTQPSLPVAASLEVQNNQLVAVPPAPGNIVLLNTLERDALRIAVLDRPVAYFIPEHVPDPSVREPGEELWVEVTVPHRGPPRPIRLGVKKGGVLTPLELQ
jgi:hypothetical protein